MTALEDLRAALADQLPPTVRGGRLTLSRPAAIGIAVLAAAAVALGALLPLARTRDPRAADPYGRCIALRLDGRGSAFEQSRRPARSLPWSSSMSRARCGIPESYASRRGLASSTPSPRPAGRCVASTSRRSTSRAPSRTASRSSSERRPDHRKRLVRPPARHRPRAPDRSTSTAPPSSSSRRCPASGRRWVNASSTGVPLTVTSRPSTSCARSPASATPASLTSPRGCACERGAGRRVRTSGCCLPPRPRGSARLGSGFVTSALALVALGLSAMATGFVIARGGGDVRRPVGIAVMCAGTVVLGVALRQQTLHEGPVPGLAADRAIGRLELVVTSDPRPRASRSVGSGARSGRSHRQRPARAHRGARQGLVHPRPGPRARTDSRVGASRAQPARRGDRHAWSRRSRVTETWLLSSRPAVRRPGSARRRPCNGSPRGCAADWRMPPPCCRPTNADCSRGWSTATPLGCRRISLTTARRLG